jgi:UDP:flavonoid glycosyltransferase YjiC (YdhE family)
MARAFSAGLPQLAVTMSHDQPDNAARMKTLGCGLELTRKKCGERTLTRILARLLSEQSFRTQARSLAREHQNDPSALDRAAEALETLGQLKPPQ